VCVKTISNSATNRPCYNNNYNNNDTTTTTTLANSFRGGLSMIIITVTRLLGTLLRRPEKRRCDVSIFFFLYSSLHSDRPTAIFPTFGFPSVLYEENYWKLPCTTLYTLILDEIDFGFFHASLV